MNAILDQKLLLTGGKILATILAELKSMVATGVATCDLENRARDLIKQAGAKPAFLGYQRYPAVLCTCVNAGIVHCVPRTDEILKSGDIISLDLGIEYRGYFFDAALTVAVGEVSDEARRLILVTKKALKRGLKKARAGNTVGDIGNTISRYVEAQGFTVIKQLCGHGIGKKLHERPEICNFGKRHHGEVLKVGQLICIEPMVAAGRDWRIKHTVDGIGWQTMDDSLAAHFEHTLLVRQDDCLVLTEP